MMLNYVRALKNDMNTSIKSEKREPQTSFRLTKLKNTTKTPLTDEIADIVPITITKKALGK